MTVSTSTAMYALGMLLSVNLPARCDAFQSGNAYHTPRLNKVAMQSPGPESLRVVISSRRHAPSQGLIGWPSWKPKGPEQEPNGDKVPEWNPDPSKFACGLPGSIPPISNFDPLDFASRATPDELKRYREAEVTHGRVAMLAAVGIPFAERIHPLFGGDIGGPAIQHLTDVRRVAPEFFELLIITIGFAELTRALIGWNPPNEFEGKRFLKPSYYPGAVGFDPFGLKPTSQQAFDDMQTKELQNGRLAMIATVGMITQEIMTGQPLFEL